LSRQAVLAKTVLEALGACGTCPLPGGLEAAAPSGTCPSLGDSTAAVLMFHSGHASSTRL